MVLYCHICNTCHRNKEHCHWTVLKALGLIFSCRPTVEDWVCQRTRCEIGSNWWVGIHVIDRMVMIRVTSAEFKSVPLTTERIQPDLTPRPGIELLVPIFQEKNTCVKCWVPSSLHTTCMKASSSYFSSWCYFQNRRIYKIQDSELGYWFI
jgi:hypothetical protein